MIEKNEIKAILFDSGNVLNFPASGHWFISPKFYEYINKETFDIMSIKTFGNGAVPDIFKFGL